MATSDSKKYYNQATWPFYEAVRGGEYTLARNLARTPDLLRSVDKEAREEGEGNGIVQTRTDRALGMGRAAADRIDSIVEIPDQDFANHRHRPSYSHIEQWNVGLYVDPEAIIAGSMEYEGSGRTRLGKHLADNLRHYADPEISSGIDDILTYFDHAIQYNLELEKSIGQLLTSGHSDINDFPDFTTQLLNRTIEADYDLDWGIIYNRIEGDVPTWVYDELAEVFSHSKQATRRL